MLSYVEVSYADVVMQVEILHGAHAKLASSNRGEVLSYPIF